MKKNCFGIIFLLLCQISFGQDTVFRKEWAWGVNAGLTFSKISFFPSISEERLLQQTGGLSVRYVSESNFGVQAELNYSLLGWKEKTDTVANPNKYSRSLAYLELPIMTYLYFDMGKKMRLIFLTGPQIGYNLSEKTLEKEIVSLPEETPKYYDQKIQRRLSYGIVAGGGLELRTGIGSFALDCRYFIGLSDIFNNQKSEEHQSSSNQVIALKLTYFFNSR